MLTWCEKKSLLLVASRIFTKISKNFCTFFIYIQRTSVLTQLNPDVMIILSFFLELIILSFWYFLYHT